MADLEIEELERRIGYSFTDRALIQRALTHASSTTEAFADNERMELLGDAVLELIVTEHIFRLFTRLGEGDLTKLRSGVVKTEALAEVADTLELVRFATFGKGLVRAGDLPPSVKANLVEAVIAAVFLDAGYGPAGAVVMGLVHESIEECACGEGDHKSILQAHAQRTVGSKPHYRVISERGPDHEKVFEVQVELDGSFFRKASGRTKKEAEQKAALKALTKLGVTGGAAEPPAVREPASGRRPEPRRARAPEPGEPPPDLPFDPEELVD